MGTRRGRDYIRTLSQSPIYRLIDPARKNKESEIEEVCKEILFEKIRTFAKYARKRVTKYGSVPPAELNKMERGLFVQTSKYMPKFIEYYSDHLFGKNGK